MANLTEERLKEMEEEMNRFEEEILSTKAAAAAAEAAKSRENQSSSRKIIGAGTFNQVQAEIANKTPNSSGVQLSHSVEDDIQSEPAVAGPHLQPPPPPPLDSRNRVNDSSSCSSFNLRPPPPPPPSFVPHQLQNRPMLAPPRPPFPPRGMLSGPLCPPGMHAGNMPHLGGMMPPPHPHPNLLGRPSMPPGGFMSRPMMDMSMRGGAQPFPFNRPLMQSVAASTLQTSAVVEKPKVVYSAPPVKRITAVESTSKMETPMVPRVVEKAPEPKKPRPDPVAKKHHAVPGIELNVPVEEIEAEKKLHYHVPVAVPAAAAAAVETEKDAASQDGTKKKEKKKKFVRMAAGTVWEDATLGEWDQDDFRLFCGDLGNEVTDDILTRAFNKYPTFVKAKVVRDKRSSKTKGFGFVSFKDPNDFMKAMREMNGKYVGNRPIKLRKSMWRDRQIDIVKKKDKEKKRLGFR